jgi:uncharacterized RDD family membrane protein YckC
VSDATEVSRADRIHVIPVEARPYQGRGAGVVSRIVAAVIDAGVALLALGVLYVVWSVILFLLHGRQFRFPSVELVQAITAGLVVFVTYCGVGWRTIGRTYGGYVLGLRVVNRDGRRIGAVQAIVRAILCAAFPIGLLWCAVSAQSRSVQDLLVRTSVIYDWEVRPRLR